MAKLKTFQFNLGLPESPLGNTSDYTVDMWINPGVTSGTAESKCNRDNGFTNYCVLKIYKTTSTGGLGAEGTIDNILGAAIINPSSPLDPSIASTGTAGVYTYFREYAGAFMARIKYPISYEFESGLYIVGIINDTNTPSASNHIFEMNSMVEHTLPKGKLILKFKGVDFYASSYIGTSPHFYSGRGFGFAFASLRMCIKLGNYYWNGTEWVNSFAYTDVQITDENVGYEIPIDNKMVGDVSVRIFASALYHSEQHRYMTDKFVTELSLDYEMDEGIEGTTYDRSENRYFRLLGTNFRDEISIGTEVASFLNNKPSPSFIMEDSAGNYPMTELSYGTSGRRRPEVDLLNRLASYYGASRQTLDLITKHPVVNNAPAIIPLLKLNGINDGKTYLPLSESRDWREETCTLTCFETPE